MPEQADEQIQRPRQRQQAQQDQDAWLPTRLLLRHRFDSLARAPHLRLPTLFLAAEDDPLVLVGDVRDLYEAWAGPKELAVLPGVDHDSIHTHPDYLPRIDGFLRQLPGGWD